MRTRTTGCPSLCGRHWAVPGDRSEYIKEALLAFGDPAASQRPHSLPASLLSASPTELVYKYRCPVPRLELLIQPGGLCLTTGSSAAAHLPGRPQGILGLYQVPPMQSSSRSSRTQSLTFPIPGEKAHSNGKLWSLSSSHEVPLYWRVGPGDLPRPEMCDRVLREQHAHPLLTVVGTVHSGPQQTPGESAGSLACSISPRPCCLDSSLWFNPKLPHQTARPHRVVQCWSVVGLSPSLD